MRNLSSAFPTRFNTNRSVHPQKMARSLNVLDLESSLRDRTTYEGETMAQISCVVKVQLL